MILSWSGLEIPTTAADRYMVGGGHWTMALQSTNQVIFYICPLTGVLRNMFFRTRTTSGAGVPGETVTATLVGDDDPDAVTPTYVPLGLSITVDQGVAFLESSNVVDEVPVVEGRRLGIVLSKSAPSAGVWQEPSLQIELVPS